MCLSEVQGDLRRNYLVSKGKPGDPVGRLHGNIFIK